MGKYGVNVPKGVAVSSVDEVRVVKATFPNENEVDSSICAMDFML